MREFKILQSKAYIIHELKSHSDKPCDCLRADAQ